MNASPASSPLSAQTIMGSATFRVMNTDVLVLTTDWTDGCSANRVRAVFEAVERRFSRFLPGSELSQLNAVNGHSVRVSPQMYSLLMACKHYHAITGGVFDPSVLPGLEAAGYNQSFDLMPVCSDIPAELPAGQSASFAEVRLRGREWTEGDMPPGMRLDFGGIAKGFAVEEAARALAEVPDFLIDAGGDILARGAGPDGDGWLVSIASPFEGGGEADRIRLRNEAVATSTMARRRWLRAGRWLPHILDPATGEPVASDVVAVTVTCATATAADVYAKSALLMGVPRGLRFLEAQGARGLFILTDGTIVASEGWQGGGL